MVTLKGLLQHKVRPQLKQCPNPGRPGSPCGDIPPLLPWWPVPSLPSGLFIPSTVITGGITELQTSTLAPEQPHLWAPLLQTNAGLPDVNGNPRSGLGSTLPAAFTASTFLQALTVSPPPQLLASGSPSFHSCPLPTFHGAGPLYDKPQTSEHGVLGPSQLLPKPLQLRLPPSLLHSDASARPITSPVYTLHASAFAALFLLPKATALRGGSFAPWGTLSNVWGYFRSPWEGVLLALSG